MRGLCAKCGEAPKAYKTGSYCKPCSAAWSRERNKKRKAQGLPTHSAFHLMRDYGCTVDEYKERMATSDCCEVCGSKERLQYDHCHDTMDFRGVLCWDCNVGIGKLGDTEEGLLKALEYLRRNK